MRILAVSIIFILLSTSGCQYISDIVSIGDRANESPVAYIDSITPAETATGETVSFIGHGTDIDGNIVAFRWYSNLDGELSVKPEFQANSLSQGTHAVSFKVQDNNGAWSDEVNHTIIVTAQAVPLPIIKLFTADPPAIIAGQSSLLKWDVSNADTVNIEPAIGTVPATGTRTVSPDVTTSYTLTASNSYGVLNIQFTVSVRELDDLKDMKEVVLHTISNEDGSLVKYDSSYQRQDVPCAGDNSLNLPSKAFLSFDISSIPQNAIVEEAVLDLSNCTVTGEPTYVRGRHGNMGTLEVYHYQYGSYDDLDRSAYIKIAQLTKGGSHQEYPLNPWKWDIKESTDGDPVIQELVQSGSSRCQLRIQFFTSTNWDGIADMICFEGTNLVIRYKLP